MFKIVPIVMLESILVLNVTIDSYYGMKQSKTNLTVKFLLKERI